MYGTASLGAYDNIEDYLKMLDIYANKKTVPKNRVVPDTFIALNNDDKVVGFISLRYELNEHLLNFGGHIGYSICNSERCKGYGSEMTKLALANYKSRGINKVLITCGDWNVGSEKVILNNNGVLEDILIDENGENHKRFLKP